jgi:hypothetical protein
MLQTFSQTYSTKLLEYITIEFAVALFKVMKYKENPSDPLQKMAK